MQHLTIFRSYVADRSDLAEDGRRSRETAERARYLQLTKQGLNISEICRRLGIGRKTGSTLVERTRYTIELPVDAAKRSESLRGSLIAAFADIPAQLRTSIN